MDRIEGSTLFLPGRADRQDSAIIQLSVCGSETGRRERVLRIHL